MICPFRRMFKMVFKQYSICVQRFVQKAFANPSSSYGRKMPSFTNRSSKTPNSAVIFINPCQALEFVFSKLADFHSWTLAGPFSRSSPHWIVQLVWMFSIGYDVLKDIASNLDTYNRKTLCLLTNASSSQAKGRSPTRHLPLPRESRFSTLTQDDVAVCRVEFLGNKKHPEVFQFKAPVGTKDGNFVLLLFGSLILDSPVKTRSRQCDLEGNLVSRNLFTMAFQWFATSHTWKAVFFSKGKSRHIKNTPAMERTGSRFQGTMFSKNLAAPHNFDKAAYIFPPPMTEWEKKWCTFVVFVLRETTERVEWNHATKNWWKQKLHSMRVLDFNAIFAFQTAKNHPPFVGKRSWPFVKIFHHTPLSGSLLTVASCEKHLVAR